jgi:hypothetical protein
MASLSFVLVYTNLRLPLLDLLGLSTSNDRFFHAPFIRTSHERGKDEICKATHLRFRDLSVRVPELSALMRAAFFLLLFFTLAFV